MNRRNFLVRLGQAATAVAATLTLDPEQLLWVPGKKTIVDLGATKQILPATDAEVLTVVGQPISPWVNDRQRQAMRDLLGGPRDIVLTLGGQMVPGKDVTFRYKDDKLVSRHTAEELRLLTVPLFPRGRRS